MNSGFSELLLWIFVFAFSVSIHEASHAITAYFLGDPTAKDDGRITLNPLKHIDPFGLLFLIIAHFGWAKPVRVNPRNFSRPRFHSALVSAAGPLSNIFLAYIALLFVSFSENRLPEVFFYIGNALFLINLFLAAFNLLPLKPLDGEGVFSILVPRRFLLEYEEFSSYGPIILFGMLGLGIFLHIDILSWILFPIVNYLGAFLEFLVFF